MHREILPPTTAVQALLTKQDFCHIGRVFLEIHRGDNTSTLKFGSEPKTSVHVGGGLNLLAASSQGGEGGDREINRTNLAMGSVIMPKT